MNYVYILCQRYLDLNLQNYTIGGIQTYIQNLIRVISSIDAIPIVIQYAAVDNRCVKDGVTVIGANTSNLKHLRSKNKKLHNVFDSEYKQHPGILLYATEGLVSPKYTKRIPSLAIQHGISWDKPDYTKKGFWSYETDYWFQSLLSRIDIKRIEALKKIVCVDYNYVNWHRALVLYPKLKFDIIPNFTEIPLRNQQSKDNSVVKIIFARRFFEYRGTRIFTNAIKRILDDHQNIDITFAGDGPDEQWMRKTLPESKKIHYIKYDNWESLKVHSDKHIAVVPTVGSEGTSLSLLEAMASQCAVVCTNVGGMTNIVINEYNGLMVNPDENELYLAIKRLIDDEKLRSDLSIRAYDTVLNGFSYDRWAKQWRKILQEMLVE